MALQTSGINIGTMLGAAAGGVSEVLEGRRKRSEQKADLFELKDRDLDDEEELSRRKDRRDKKTEMETWIATINSYLPAKEAQKAILEFSNNGHASVGVLSSRLAELGKAGLNPEQVLRHNRGIADPANPNAQFLNLLATPVGKKDPKAKTTFQAMFTDLSDRKNNATSIEEFNQILREEENVIKDHLRYSESLASNESKGATYESRFSKGQPTARSFGDFDLLLKQEHGFDLSMTEEITLWKEGNKLKNIEIKVGHSRRLDEIEKMYKDSGTNIAKEPDWTASKFTFQESAILDVENYINGAYSSGENVVVSKKDTANGFNVNSPATWDKLTTTSEDIKAALSANRNAYKIGAVVPFVSKKGFLSSWIYTGKPTWNENIFLLGQSTD
jgi:hypothetical protein